MLFYCYSEMCIVEHDCECGSSCCSGVFHSPAVYTLEDEDLTQNQKVGLVLHHVCPNCTGWVEC